VNNDGDDTAYGARWHWDGAQHDYNAPLKSPSADVAAQQGYSAGRAQSPKQATWVNPATPGSSKLEFGQGRPMAKDASGAGTNFSKGETSQEGALTVRSRLFFDGTVAGSASVDDLSRLTDAREKGRIGILGSALSYAGSYGRVTSESMGRDLNPLGRGDGRAYGTMWRVATLTPPWGANCRTEHDYHVNGAVKLVQVYDAGVIAESAVGSTLSCTRKLS
jgi:hypothetical protein